MAGTELGDPNLLRILISTDNHLGVWEKDETRRDDSFRAFEEVLQLAVEKSVDFVLLGGDLFHENKPSRSTLVKAIQLLSKYCLNDRAVRFRILSDQSANFVSGRVNFENPNLNIGLPVFTIHGNHDDPSGQDSLSAVDILSQTGLVNYFGKHPLVGSGAARVTLSPVLMEKGSTRLCMYGLGNIRDERLGRAFQTPGCVQWQRPASTPQYPSDSWINMLVLHQNRVQHSAFAKSCVREEHLPAFLDLVVWGHEHECRPDPVSLKGEGEGRYVVQPGSTVATALSEGESRPKHALLLEVKGTNFRLQKFRLRSVRPFEFEFVALKDAQPRLLPEDTEGVTAFLTAKIQEMTTRTTTSPLSLPSCSRGDGGCPSESAPPLLPLIRLRVDYTGFSTVNAQRLGQRFVGKVANPHDMLQWTKAAARKVKGDGDGGGSLLPGGGGAYDDEGGYLRPEALDQSRIEDLIRQHLGANALEVLPDDELAIALHNFVEKDDKNALHQCIEAALEETRNAAVAGQLAALEVEDGSLEAEAGAGQAAGGRGLRRGVVGVGEDEEELLGAVRAGVERRRKQRLQRQLAAGGDEDGVDLNALTAGVTSADGTGAYGGGAGVDEQMADVAPPAPAPSQATTVGRGRGRGRGGKQQSLADSLARGGAGRGRGTPGRASGGPLDAFLQPSGGTQQTLGAGRARGGKTAAAAAGAVRGRGRSRGSRAALSTPTAGGQDGSDVEMTEARGGAASDEDGIEDLEDEDVPATAPTAKRTLGAGRGRGTAAAKAGAGAGGATPGTVARGRSTRSTAGGGSAKRKSYRVEDSDEDVAGSDDDDDDEEEEDINEGDEEEEEEEDVSPPPTVSRGLGKAAAGSARAGTAARGAAGAGRGRGRMAAGAATPAAGGTRGGSRGGAPTPAPAAAPQDDVITLTSDDDDEPGPSLGPPAARAHAAAGAAFVATAGGLGTTQGGTGVTPSGTTQGGGGGAGAAPGARKRPASFFTSGGATQGLGRGGVGRGWGPPR